MARLAVCWLLLACAAQLARAYPALYVARVAKGDKSCQGHPNKGYAAHGAPKKDPKIVFAVADSAGKAVVSVCPGATYDIKLTFPEPRLALLTASSATFKPKSSFLKSSDSCVSRVAMDRSNGYGPMATQTATATLPCDASGNLNLKVTSATGSKSPYMQASASLPVDQRCAAPSCGKKGAKAGKDAPGAAGVVPAKGSEGAASEQAAPAAPATAATGLAAQAASRAAAMKALGN